jgi:hypothetical protein
MEELEDTVCQYKKVVISLLSVRADELGCVATGNLLVTAVVVLDPSAPNAMLNLRPLRTPP